VVEGSAKKGLHLLIMPQADSVHFRSGVPARDAQRLHQGSTLRVGGDATGGRLHDDGIEVFVNPSARFHPGGEETALPQFGGGHGEVTHLGGEHPLSVSVAVGGVFFWKPLMPLCADGGGHPGFQQVLQPPAHDLRDLGASGGAFHQACQLNGVRMGKGHGLWMVGGSAPNKVTDRPTHCHS
jgi:hypothetical protein